MKKVVVCFLVMLALLISGSVSAEVILYRDGRADAAVVLPQKPNNVEQIAAQELSEHLRQATGADFAIVKESDFNANQYHSAIYVGNCKATRDAGINIDNLDRFQGVIKTFGNNLHLTGKDDNRYLLRSVNKFIGLGAKPMVSAGTLFAVYDFLDRDLGVIHLWPGKTGTYVPKKKELKFASIDRNFKPWGPSSSFWINNSIRNPKDYWGKPEAFTRFEEAQKYWLLRHRFHAAENYVYCFHDFEHYWHRFGKTNPAFFSLLPDGERRPLKGDIRTKSVSMCVSNSGLHRQIADDYQKQYNSNARTWERNRLGVGENDTPGLCTCAACRAWDDPNDQRFAGHSYWGKGTVPIMTNRFVLLRSIDGSGSAADAPSLSDRYCRFYLAVQAEARKFNPDVNVVGFAYGNYAEFPKYVKMNENVIISFVGWPYFPFTPERMAKARANWDGWRATGATMLLRPNATHVGHNMPVFYGRQLGNEFRHAYHNGAISVSYDSLTGQWGAQSASLYIMSRLNARPDLTVDEVLSEYYSAFGPARDAIKDYTEYLEKNSDAVNMEQVNEHTKKLKLASPPTFKNWLQLADTVFSSQFFAHASTLLKKAADQAKNDPEVAERVKFLQIGLEHAEKTYDTLIIQRTFQKESNEKNRLAFQKSFTELWDYRHSIEDWLGTDLDYLALREPASGWKYEPKK